MLLFVFLLGAIAAISLYIELPKAAFEAQRSREELLIERGMEYRRGIQLYFRKEKKYPPNLDALEKTSERRYLRRRYLDPMTGKDEWRVINIGPNGEFTNSLVHKQANPLEKKDTFNSTYLTETAGLGQTPTNAGPGAVTVANRMRPSDQVGAPGQGPGQGQEMTPGFQGTPGMQPQQQFPGPVDYSRMTGSQPVYGQPGFPQQQPGFPQQQQGFPQMQPGFPQQQQGFPQQQPGFAGFPQTGGVSPFGAPASPFATRPPTGAPTFGMPGTIPSSSQTGGVVPQQGFGGFPGQFQQPQQQQPQYNPGFGQTPLTTNPQVANQIMTMIMQPRPAGGAVSGSGAPGSSAFGTPGTGGLGGGIVGGIAGVASKFEAEGIKVINERTKYNEWEFLYDYKKEVLGQAAAGGTRGPQTNAPGTGAPQQQGGFGTGSGFGTQGFGNQSPMGNQTSPTIRKP